MLNPGDVASLLSAETGLTFTASEGKDNEGQPWILLHPDGGDPKHTFGIRLTIGWRRIEISFEPGSFAAPLLEEMGQADQQGRAVFASMLADCFAEGAEIRLRVNGSDRTTSDPTIWNESWTRIGLVLRKGDIEIGDLDAAPAIEIIRTWALRFAAAIISILPLDNAAEEAATDRQQGFPEGASTTVTVNRYERDRRNRAAAIAIHGVHCHGCGMSFGDRYGTIALGFIEIHHLVPVSGMDPDYLVDPRRDLIPLCSNCHSVVHREDPPMKIDALRALLRC